MATATATEVKKSYPGSMDTGFRGTGSGVDTVWIGFMDIVPVIGTVKEAVELVLALYGGNKGMVMEKEKAIENILKIQLSLTDKKENYEPKSTKPAAEVRMEKIIECVKKGSKKAQEISQAEQKKEKEKREKRVEEIKEDMLKKVRIIQPDFYAELTEELKRSRRGEHVFNNDILRFHYKVLVEFLNKYGFSNLPQFNEETMKRLARHTLSPNTAKQIETEMVVHFDDDEFYVNANSIMYGAYCRNLREAFFKILGHINPLDVTEEEKERVNFVIDNMNNFEIYVDHLAKQKWIGNNGDKLNRFLAVKQEVVEMYKTKRGVEWSTNTLREVERLLGRRHFVSQTPEVHRTSLSQPASCRETTQTFVLFNRLEDEDVKHRPLNPPGG
ncbi:hypothetical protein C0J50_4469 [Silurus asotus]|uniref:Uncharacterized protein n=1 Tax=Silurus asotus TaxID=30991 RepID=A0AAD5AAW8_SILAS|nr:hypothetical protein C0J50_4469 [Silurus asotus]